MATKDDKNLQKVLGKIASMNEPERSVMQRMHDVITEAAPELKPRIWYGMPGYALHASSPVLVFFRNDERMTLGLSEGQFETGRWQRWPDSSGLLLKNSMM